MNLMAFQVHPFLLFSVFSLLSLLSLLHPHHIQPLNFPNCDMEYDMHFLASKEPLKLCHACSIARGQRRCGCFWYLSAGCLLIVRIGAFFPFFSCLSF
ncbi:hypothetical protein CsSME_00006657 [Camellia sinensis var. sinensis]